MKKLNHPNKKILWFFGFVGLIVIISWPVLSYFLGKERGLIYFLLLVSLYGFISAIYMLYHAIRYKKIISIVPETTGSKPITEKEPVKYYFSFLLYIAMIIFFGWVLMTLLIYKF